MTKGFEEAFAALNKEQKRAVEKTDGPVLVVAGPGTGKTQLLSTRVAYIIKNSDTQPGEILCLTFTNKAAVNMKDRIIELAGQSGARVPAATFHSFAAEIMNLHPDQFWDAARLTIAPDAVQLDIIESIVAELPFDNPLALKFAGQYTLLKDIQEAIKLAKEAGLTPAKLRALAKFNLSYIDKIEKELADITAERLSAKKLPAIESRVAKLTKQEVDLDYFPLVSLSQTINNELGRAIESDVEAGKTSQTSRWKGHWIQTVNGQRGMFKERERNQWWLNLADIYESYRDALHERVFYDYADMLVEVISVLEQKPEILADVQERFNYVMVDEFQDSTPAQLRFAHLIADHHTSEGKPNLMVVGDDDQTIYKFNGAEVNNMLNFERYYPSATKIVLVDNYRSSQDILDFAKKVIEQADIRLVKLDPTLSKSLVAQNSPKPTGKIQTIAFAAKELQLLAVAQLIKKNYKPGRQIVVLARGHDSLITMAGFLQQQKVPVRYEQASNILDNQIVEQVYLIAKLLLAVQEGNQANVDELIHQIIRWPAWGLDPQKLWRLAANNFRKGRWLESLLDNKELRFRELGEWFIWLARAADQQPLAVTIEQILGLRPSDSFTSPIQSYFRSATTGAIHSYFRGLSAIQLLRNLAHEFGAGKQPSLIDLVRYVEVNRQNQVIVPDESPFITDDQAVQLMTVHKAKGLEFDDVYIIDAIENSWQPRKGGRKPPANLPLQPPGDDLDDYIRLMYVAITRAKANVTISGYNQDHSGKDVSLSPIIQSVQSYKVQQSPSEPKLMNVLEDSLRWPDLERGQEQAILKARLEAYSLSPTHLLSFLDLSRGGPDHYKERVLLELPYVKNVSQSFGTAIHDSLEAAQIDTNKNQFELAKVKSAFKQSLSDEQLPNLDFVRQLKKGDELLNNLFNKLAYQLPKGSLPEQKIRGIKLGQATINGKLDRVDKTQDGITIVDYKSGKPLPSFDTKDKNQAIKAWRHKLQLVFYALLAQNYSTYSKHQAINCQMVYLEADNQRGLIKSYTPTKIDIDRLNKLIQAVWAKIINLDLPDTSKYSPDLAGILEFEEDLIKNTTPGKSGA